MEKRKIEEIEFHNKREIDRNNLTSEEFEKKYSNKKVYQISDSSFEYLEKKLKELSKDKICLDYCCGLGNTSLNLYKYGAKKVYGIDIAEKEVETAKSVLKANGYDDSGIVVGDAEFTNFEDNKFDLIVCIGVLHHLDVNKAFKELNRILKPGGSVVAFEALGYNPIIQAYRRLTPHLRTDWEKDHILTNREIKIAMKYFSSVNIKYFHLLNLVLFPFTKAFFFKPLLRLLTSIDNIILRIPFLRLMAWQMVFILKK